MTSNAQTHFKQDPAMNGSIRDSHRLSRKRSKYERGLLGRYRLLRTIGTGNFAKVKLAIHILTNKEVAIKIIDKNELSPSSKQKLSREVNLMKQLDHPNIIKLLEIIDTDRIMYLVLEYASKGELYEYLANHGRMKEKVAREKFRQILSAVEYCHQKHIIHRDLKMENLMLDADLNIKLGDFGFANEYEDGKKLNTFCGSPPYAAPELFRGKEYNGPEVDVWSLGVILFKLVTGNLPFDGHSLSELRERVLRGKYRIPFFMSTECERLLKKMLLLNPSKRHSLQSIMKDPWVNMDYENEPLAPYEEPKTDSLDPVRVQSLMDMGFNLDSIFRSLKSNAFDEITTAYFLLQKHKTNINGTTEDDAESASSVQLHPQSPESRVQQSSVEKVANGVTDAPDSCMHLEESVEEKQALSNGINRKSSQFQPEDEELQSDSSKKLPTLQRKSTEHLRTEPGINTAPHIIGVKTVAVTQKRNNTNESTRILSSNGYATRPKTTYEAITSDRIQTPEARERRVQPSHWYPTGGLAVHNWTSNTQVPTIDKSNRNDALEMSKQTSLYTRILPADEGKYGHIQKAGLKPTASPIQTDILPQGSSRIQEPHEIIAPRSNVPDSRQLATPEFCTNFYRANPLRQTIHAACRLKLDEPPESPGMAEIKNTPVAVARSNLFEPDIEVEPENAEVTETDKPKGLFRSLTSRFSKKSIPTSREIQGNVEQKLHKPAAEHLARTQCEATVSISPESAKPIYSKVVHQGEVSTPKSPIHRSSFASRTITNDRERLKIPFSTLNNGETGSGFTEDADVNGSGLSKIRRSFALRFSKRKTYDNGSINNSILDNNEQSPNTQPPTKGDPLNHQSSSVGHYRVTKPNVTTENEGADIPVTFQPTILSITSVPSNDAGRISRPTDEDTSVAVKPKAMRFLWSVKATSRLPADDIVLAIKRVLDRNRYSYVQQHKYYFLCEEHTRLFVGWEMEICAVSKPNQYGIRFKKLSGTSVTYKTVVAGILNELDI